MTELILEAPPAGEGFQDADDRGGARVELRYLDLDGDGLPDAVQTTTVRVLFASGDAAFVEVVEKTEVGIDDDGVPSSVQVAKMLRIELGLDTNPALTGSERHEFSDLALSAR